MSSTSTFSSDISASGGAVAAPPFHNCKRSPSPTHEAGCAPTAVELQAAVPDKLRSYQRPSRPVTPVRDERDWKLPLPPNGNSGVTAGDCCAAEAFADRVSSVPDVHLCPLGKASTKHGKSTNKGKSNWTDTSIEERIRAAQIKELTEWVTPAAACGDGHEDLPAGKVPVPHSRRAVREPARHQRL